MTSGGAETNPTKPIFVCLLLLASIPLAIASFACAMVAGIDEPFMGGAYRPASSFKYLGLPCIVALLWIEWLVLLVQVVRKNRLRALWLFVFIWALPWALFWLYVTTGAIWEYSGDVWRWETHWVPKWTERHRAEEAAREAAEALGHQPSPPSTAPSPDPVP